VHQFQNKNLEGSPVHTYDQICEKNSQPDIIYVKTKFGGN